MMALNFTLNLNFKVSSISTIKKVKLVLTFDTGDVKIDVPICTSVRDQM